MNVKTMSMEELRQMESSLDGQIIMNASYPGASDHDKRKLEEVQDEIRARKVRKPLVPIVTDKQQKERLRRVTELEEVYERIGGGVFQVTAEEGDDGWTVWCAFVQRDLKNNKGEPLPDAGLLDIEATKGSRKVVCDSREIIIYGKPSNPNPIVEKVVNDSGIGVVTRKRGGAENDSSGEIVMALYTPGEEPESAKDSQFNRKIVKVKIGPDGKILYNYFGVSGYDRLPVDLCTEKVLLATHIASDICKVLNEQ